MCLVIWIIVACYRKFFKKKQIDEDSQDSIGECEELIISDDRVPMYKEYKKLKYYNDYDYT